MLASKASRVIRQYNKELFQENEEILTDTDANVTISTLMSRQPRAIKRLHCLVFTHDQYALLQLHIYWWNWHIICVMFTQDQYALLQLQILVNLCEEGVAPSTVLQSITSVCSGNMDRSSLPNTLKWWPGLEQSQINERSCLSVRSFTWDQCRLQFIECVNKCISQLLVLSCGYISQLICYYVQILTLKGNEYISYWDTAMESSFPNIMDSPVRSNAIGEYVLVRIQSEYHILTNHILCCLGPWTPGEIIHQSCPTFTIQFAVWVGLYLSIILSASCRHYCAGRIMDCMTQVTRRVNIRSKNT